MFASCSLLATISRVSKLFISDSEQPVPRVAQARQDEALLIQLLVNGGSENGQVRIMRMHVPNALGRRHEVDQPHAPGTELSQQVHSSDSAPTGGQHWIN